MEFTEEDVLRFERKVSEVRGCWIWRGGTRKTFWLNGAQVYAHRFAYEAYIGPLAPEIALVQNCKELMCVHPKHQAQALAANFGKVDADTAFRVARQRDQHAIVRFMEKVGPLTATGCREWQAAFQGNYGTFFLYGKSMLAHRASVILFKGEDPGEAVLHSCDNTRCVNPEHLTPGTSAQNSADMVAKGRNRSGTALVSSEEVSAIKAEYTAADGSLSYLSRKYGLSKQAVYAIINAVNWRNIEPNKHIRRLTTDEILTQREKGADHHNSKLTEADVRAMRMARENGESITSIAEKFGIKKAQASAICARKAWKHVS